MVRELEYDPVDDEGNPLPSKKFEDWRRPDTDFQRRVLHACHFPDLLWPPKKDGGKKIKGKYVMVEKAMMPLTSGLVSRFPTEWVDSKIAWATKMNYPIRAINLDRLYSAITNYNLLEEFIAKWQRQNPELVIRDRVSKEASIKVVEGESLFDEEI